MVDRGGILLDAGLAWRNIWRNTRRSVLFLLAVTVGLFGLLASLGLMNGFSAQMVESALGTHIPDVQVNRAGFHTNPVLEHTITRPDRIRTVLDSVEGVRAWAPRVLVQGMAQSSEGSEPVQVVGIDPARERSITVIADRVMAGSYLDAAEGAGVLVGERLSRRLGLEMGQRLVLLAQSREGDLATAAFPITGLFRTASPDFDRRMVYLGIEDARAMFDLEEGVSQFALRAAEGITPPRLAGRLRQALPGERFEVLPWGEVVPALLRSVELWNLFTYIFFAIVFVAMVFGIMNTMTMAVFERIREFGVMTAMGTRPGHLFRMVLLEAAQLGLLGVAAGYAATGVFMLWLGTTGLDLSVFSDALASLGAGSVTYPVLPLRDWVLSGLMALFFALLSAVLPALKAARFEPVEALRHVG
ncbi:MAG: FtsX-like permease family protein [bacterium]